MKLLELYFSHRGWWTTLLMFAAVAVMVRLGVWQLDRLEARRAFNAQVTAMQAAPPLVLEGAANVAELTAMEYRSASATGVYDFANQIALRNQYWGDPDGRAEYGYHILTPLILAEGTAVLVDRGWVAGEYDRPASWRVFDEPASVTVTGILRLGRAEAEMGGQRNPVTIPGQPNYFWIFPDMGQINAQMPYRLLPVYLQQAPDGAQVSMPYQALPVLDLNDGPHLGYALQWFFYAALLFLGYPVSLRKQVQSARS
ncbi:MAG: SURF1 family protein [Anaerolineales bacterium]|nr:SURF1 family protein [Anaerolineales bacterium]